MRLVKGLPSAATRIFMACLSWRYPQCRAAPAPGDLPAIKLHVDHLEGLEAAGFALARQAARLANAPRAARGVLVPVVVPAVQVAVQPDVGQRQQVIVRIAEARGARLRAEAWVGAAQAGREVGDHQCRVNIRARRAQVVLEPGAAGEPLLA